MAEIPYPHLGWDPAPGIPAEIAALRAKLTASATSLGTAHRLVAQLLGESSYWQGEAADAFREALDGELPRYLKNAHHSLSKAAARLGAWHDDLVGYQATARAYETRAALEAATVRKAEATDTTVRGTPGVSAADLTAAADGVTRARAALEDVRRLARELEETHRVEAGRVAKSLNEATDRLAPKEPGRAGGLLDWVDGDLGDGLSFLSAVAGLAAVLLSGPLLVPVLFLAAGLSLAAFVAHAKDPKLQAALKGGLVEGRLDAKFWGATVTLAGDAVGALPGVGAVAQGAKGMAAAVRTGRATGEGVAAGLRSGAGTFATGSGTAMRHIDDAPKPLTDWVVRRTGPRAERPVLVGASATGVATSGTGLVTSEENETARNTASAVDGVRLAGSDGPNLTSAARAWVRAAR